MKRSRLVVVMSIVVSLIVAYSYDTSTNMTVSAQVTDSLKDYAQECDQAIGVTVPKFSCDAGTVVPELHLNPPNAIYPNGDCDQPNRLNEKCDPGSRFQVLFNNDDAAVVAHCRKKGRDPGFYGDIAVIQTNKKNGATCFYQALGNLYSEVKAPSDGTGKWDPDPNRPGNWMTPAATAGTNCVACHDNGALIRSPYLTQISGPNELPGAHDPSFNKNQPYYFIGSDFASWAAFKVEVAGSLCNNCHRMGTSNLFSFGISGTALDFGIRATGQSEVHKNPHSQDSPIWMIPGQVTFSQSSADAAEAIKNCALRREENPLPSGPDCTITRFTGAGGGIKSVYATISPIANADGWSNHDTVITLAELSPRISVQSITYEAKGAQPISKTTVSTALTTLTINQAGETTVLYSGTRFDGKLVLPGIIAVKLDKTAPVSKATVTSGNAPGESIVTIIGEDEANGSGIKLVDYYAFGPVAKVERPDAATLLLTVTASAQIYYWSVDIAGNYEGPYYLDFRPIPQLAPTNIDFKSPVGISSAPKSVTLKNTGKTTLNISQISTDSYSFNVQSNSANPCGTTLAPGAECQIDIVFYPFTDSAYNGTLYVGTNGAHSPITVALTGKGTTSAVEFSPLPLLFSDTAIHNTSQPQMISIKSAGEAPLTITDASAGYDFVIQNDNCGPKPKTLLPGETCDMAVAFKPAHAGALTGGLVLTDNTPGHQSTAPLIGVGLAVPEASFDTSSLDFDQQPVNTIGKQLSVVLTNMGTAELNITALSVGGTNAKDFSIVGGSCNPDAVTPIVVLTPEKTCTAILQFGPTDLGNRAADLLFATNLVSQPQLAVSLIGVGTSTPLVAVTPTNLTFNDWPVNNVSPSAFQVITLTNNTASLLTIRSVSITGVHSSDFIIVQGADDCSNAEIKAGGACKVEVAFTPTVVGNRTAEVAFVDLANNTYTVAVDGKGVGALISFDPPNLSFEDLPVGAFSQSQKVTLINTGNTNLTVTSVSVVGDYLQSTWCTFVTPGGFCEIKVVFQPSAVGVRAGQLVISSDALGAPYTVNLTGTGLAAGVTLDTPTLAFADQATGTSSAPLEVKLTSSGRAAVSINDIKVSGDFQIVGHTCSVNPSYQPSGTSCIIKIVFSPSATGLLTGALTIVSNAPDSPHVVTLKGNGT